MIESVWLIPFLPLLGAVIAAVGGRWLKQQAHWPVILGIVLAFCVSLTLIGRVGPPVLGHHEAESSTTEEAGAARSHTTIVYHWLQVGEPQELTIDGESRTVYELDIPIEFRVDGLTVMMLLMVTFVASFVAIFASGYMAGDPGYPRFFALVGLFVFSMSGLVLSSNYVLTYGFWEGVGTCSYLLVGFWYAKPSAALAAKKAFLVNRVGDVGFAIALFVIWASSMNHDLSYDVVLSAANIKAMSFEAELAIALLLLWAATAKSAQIPLYVWLPDAMEGPTPVSALIHAATMVTAGVYVLARSSALVFAVTVVPPIICVIGGATALLAAAMAVTQTDLKRVLAYSTISQLGYMFMALGAGVDGVMVLAVVAAMFHLFTHAFFKALLFLASGSVMHAMGGVIDMRRFRGLRHRLPWTCWTFAIGGLALAGIPPFAGFFSKDEILAALNHASHAAEEGAGWGIVYSAVYWVAILTAFLTALYTGRAFFLTFFGPEKLPSPDDPEAEPEEREAAHAAIAHDAGDDHGSHVGHGHDDHFGHESGPVMTFPLIILAACSILVGIIFGPWTGLFEGFLERTPTFANLEFQPHGTDWLSMGLGTVAALGGVLIAWWFYAAPSVLPGKLARGMRWLYQASAGKFYVDELYQAIIIKPTRAIAAVCKFLDIYLVDGLVRLVAWIPRMVGRDLLGPFQNGLVQFYAGVMALGVVVLLLALLLR